MEGCQVVTCDVPGSFIQADLDEVLHIKVVGEIAELLVKVDPSHVECETHEKGKPVIYVC